MNRRTTLLTLIVFKVFSTRAQDQVDSFRIYDDVRVTLDLPSQWKKNAGAILVIYALPNGNSIEQTMGKKMSAGTDWHFDIQHIRAQTKFIRQRMRENMVVAYLENNYHSWPSWKQKHKGFKDEISHMVDTLYQMIPSKNKCIFLNGHSGGGSFIFGYLDASNKIPSQVRRISFIDSNYGYDSSYAPKLMNWLEQDKRNTLTVFAYNDSLALYNGKPVVSEKGGTWYHSHQMQKDLEAEFHFSLLRNDSLIEYESNNRQVMFYLKTNPEHKILHTQQVELNGFIHSVLYRTKKENEGYEYFGSRSYTSFIE